MTVETDICIIGAGAAGLMAGCLSACGGAKVLIVESNSSAAVKLSLTGNGRCNMTHAGTVDEIIRAYRPYDKFVRHCLHEFSPADLLEFFSGGRLETVTEPSGCVFPKSNRSSDVKRVFLDELKKLGCKIFFGTKVKTVEKRDGFFLLRSAKFEITSRVLIIATGGVSYPATGSTGDGYKFAKSLGHKIISPLPGLCGLLAEKTFCRPLAGVSIEKVRLFCKIDGKKFSGSGGMIFTHIGISGPAVLDLSRKIAEPLSKSELQISIDFLPDLNREQLDAAVGQYFLNHPKQNVAAAVSRFLPKKPAQKICEKNHLSDLTAAQVSKKGRIAICSDIKSMPLTIFSAEPIEKATVTAGGVDICQVQAKTMASRLCEGLFFAGEVLNVDGPCGGYNLQFAFSSGALAAKSAVELLKKIP